MPGPEYHEDAITDLRSTMSQESMEVTGRQYYHMARISAGHYRNSGVWHQALDSGEVRKE